MSLRRAQGWEPTERTRYIYAADGRMVESVTTRESEFDRTDLDWFHALAELESQELPHGFLAEDATSPDADPANPDGPWQFVAGRLVRSPEGEVMRAPTVDYAAKARLDAEDRMRGRDPDPHNGVFWPVYRIPRRRPKRRKPGDD